MADIGWCHCPECKRWVPETKMNRDIDPETKQLTRVCNFCLGLEEPDRKYVVDEHFGEVECIYCGSHSVVEQAPNWCWFKCNDCGEVFRRM